jgi:Cu2+-exporting ATPase
MASADNNTFTKVKKTFPVLNMTCASCATSAQSILEHQPGVINAAVNYANTTANIEFDPTVTNTKKLKEVLQGIGYDLMIDESEDAKESLEALNLEKYKTLRNKTIGSVAISFPLVITGMFLMDLPFTDYIMWALATPVVMLFGQQFFVGAYKQARHGSANMDTLVALSTGIAYLFSVFNTLFPEFWHARGLHAHVYFEAAAVVITFILLGKYLVGYQEADGPPTQNSNGYS